MDLKGWDYTGRNIGPEFHRQFRVMVDALSDPGFVGARTWGNSLQDSLAKRMRMASSGAVRTVKRISENFGLIERSAFSSREIPTKDTILTARGKIIYTTATLEHQIQTSPDTPEEVKKRAEKEIKILYEEAYCDALAHYYYTNDDGSHLCPLRATLKALTKYGRLDKWEWYMLNTFILRDDDPAEEAKLDEMMRSYRNGDFQLTMANVVAKPKGHQYIPQYFEYAGLVRVSQRPEWFICQSERHGDVKEKVLADDFLSTLYRGGTI